VAAKLSSHQVGEVQIKKVENHCFRKWKAKEIRKSERNGYWRNPTGNIGILDAVVDPTTTTTTTTAETTTICLFFRSFEINPPIL
jgi:hypothetical protein